jgi:hypothetical protein
LLWRGRGATIRPRKEKLEQALAIFTELKMPRERDKVQAELKKVASGQWLVQVEFGRELRTMNERVSCLRWKRRRVEAPGFSPATEGATRIGASAPGFRTGAKARNNGARGSLG